MEHRTQAQGAGRVKRVSLQAGQRPARLDSNRAVSGQGHLHGQRRRSGAGPVVQESHGAPGGRARMARRRGLRNVIVPHGGLNGTDCRRPLGRVDHSGRCVEGRTFSPPPFVGPRRPSSVGGSSASGSRARAASLHLESPVTRICRPCQGSNPRRLSRRTMRRPERAAQPQERTCGDPP